MVLHRPTSYGNQYKYQLSQLRCEMLPAFPSSLRAALVWYGNRYRLVVLLCLALDHAKHGDRFRKRQDA